MPVMHEMPDPDANKKLVLEYLNALGNLDADAVLSLISDEITLDAVDVPVPSGSERKQGKQEIARELQAMKRILPNGFEFELLSIMAEGNRVHCEIRASAATVSKKQYKSRYSFVLAIRDGLITNHRDYMDTYLATTFWSRYLGRSKSA